MYYKLAKNRLERIRREDYEDGNNVVAVMGASDISKGSIIFCGMALGDEREEIHCCKVERQEGFLHGVVQVPIHNSSNRAQEKGTIPLLGQGHTFARFSFYIAKGRMLFLDYDDIVIQTLRQWKKWNTRLSMEQLIYRIMASLVEDDVITLDNIYKQLAALEEEIPKDNARFFLQRMYAMKHTIYQMFRYYHQLTEFAQELMDCGGTCFDEEGIAIFSDFSSRTQRLAEDIEIMREYAMEIWEIYQSQINIRQNDIMKVLTIVTTIFLPLSLLTGWYGMNFAYMPEIRWMYGYPMVMGIALFIIVFCLVLFKKKKYW